MRFCFLLYYYCRGVVACRYDCSETVTAAVPSISTTLCQWSISYCAVIFSDRHPQRCLSWSGYAPRTPRKRNINKTANTLDTVPCCCPLQGFRARREGGAGAGWVRGGRPESRTGKRTQSGLHNFQPIKVALPLLYDNYFAAFCVTRFVRRVLRCLSVTPSFSTRAPCSWHVHALL